MSGVCGYENACGDRKRLGCPYSTCDGCPLKPDSGRLAGVPKVMVYDGDGKPMFEGWYWRFQKRNGYPFFEGKTGEPEYVEGVVRCVDGDWGLENHFILTSVTPPHYMEVIG